MRLWISIMHSFLMAGSQKTNLGLEEVIETGEPEDVAFDPALGTWSRDSALISISGHGRFPAPDGLSHCEDNAMSYAMVGRVKLDIERCPASSIPAD